MLGGYGFQVKTESHQNSSSSIVLELELRDKNYPTEQSLENFSKTNSAVAGRQSEFPLCP